MSSNYINANCVTVEDRRQPSKVKLKLRITLIFRTLHTSQSIIRNAFRKGEIISEEDNGDILAKELSGSDVRFVDEDEKSNEYVIRDKTYVVDEASPKAMERMAKSIDTDVERLCYLSDVEKIAICFFIPSLSDSPIIPTLFFQSFPPKCILSDYLKHFLYKIEKDKSNIVYFGFDSITRFNRGDYTNGNYANEALSQTIVQLSALICQYTYFYLDYYELNDWSLFKDSKTSIASKESIKKYFSEPIIERPNSIGTKIRQAIEHSLSLPANALKKTIEILCNYDGHLKGRIYERIKEICDITGNDLYQTITDILLTSKELGHPVSLYEYYQKCGYWDNYLKKNTLRGEAMRWKAVKHEKGYVSGYGSLLFTNGKDYIYCMKGTDFDSYGRDWILTNLLQGLTGFSLQHVRAVKEGKKLDSEVGKRGNVWFTGHSLGGGLSSAATIATKGRIGITFNAAGLNVIGVKINQLFNNPSSIIHPSQSWNRVYPYRIKGEVLDQVQEKCLRPITFGTLERGYGKKTVEIDFWKDEKKISCLKRHGINNFLYKEILSSLQPFNDVSNDQTSELSNKGSNKVIKIIFSAKNASMEADLK